MPQEVRVLSGGAAKGLVTQLQDRFNAQSGFTIRGDFGAVGAMRDQLLAGEPCDVVILSQSLIDQLARDGHVVTNTVTPLGAVKTGVAVKSGERAPDVGTASALKSALLAAKGIYFPDPQKATAGIHFMKVLKSLGIDEQLASRLRTYPNGATAMREMGQSAEAGLIGCTQVTEIRYTPGVQLIGLLPTEFELATVYTAAVCTKAQQPAIAAELIALLTGADAANLRAAGGFEH
ncbi:MAG: periplasmic component of an type molybdate transport system-like protein [Ramlibacter sp.]|jgi:molybdate transport system substrate-binding protein|nr:periplasmic component of an type molybdate transport system-like protein [Ramlibacter sp.]